MPLAITLALAASYILLLLCRVSPCACDAAATALVVEYAV
jgi:hypothetical protein